MSRAGATDRARSETFPEFFPVQSAWSEKRKTRCRISLRWWWWSVLASKWGVWWRGSPAARQGTIGRRTRMRRRIISLAASPALLTASVWDVNKVTILFDVLVTNTLWWLLLSDPQGTDLTQAFSSFFLLLHSYSSLGLEFYNYDKICFDKNNFPGGKKRRRQKLGRTALVMRGALPAIPGCLHSTSLYKKSTWQKLRSGISILDYQPKQWINFRINSDQMCQVSLATLSSLFHLIPNHSTWV